MPETRPSVLIAGITGFIGRALARRLQGRFRVIGLSRTPPGTCEGSEWRCCDLFSLLQCEKALEGVHQAFYLVHSMLPSAHLTQGNFEDMDLIIADNFARAAARAGVRQIIYLGGLSPESGPLSRHLRSRLEVEKTLSLYGTPVTSLHSGVVIGARGSSYKILETFLRRLPVVPCPVWTNTPMQPIALQDLLELLVYCLEHPSGGNRRFEVGCPDVMSYREFLARLARQLGLRRVFVGLPGCGTQMARRVVSLVTGAPAPLVRPLIESMKCPMAACSLDLQREAGIRPMGFEQAVRKAQEEEKEKPDARRISKLPRHTVRSVQRMPLPSGWSARRIAEEYVRWIPGLFRTGVVAEADSELRLRFRLAFPRVLLLELSYAADRSAASDRQVFYVTGGWLAHKTQQLTRRPRLEFREALGGACLLAAIHDYRPTLPWPLYNLTQAWIHLWVMRRFAQHLRGAAET